MSRRPHGPRAFVPALLALCTLLRAPATAGEPSAPSARLFFEGSGHTRFGDWSADGSASSAAFAPGAAVRLDVRQRLAPGHLAARAAAKLPVSAVVLPVTAERTFDADGWLRLPSDERMSTLLTPAGLAIEGGVIGAVTDRYGYAFRTTLDLLGTVPAALGTEVGDAVAFRFRLAGKLPADLPPGLYRLRLDFGAKTGTRTVNLNGYTFAGRPLTDQQGTSCYFYSPLVPSRGTTVSWREVDGATLVPRVPWVLLSAYNSNGYRGVVADEDRGRFAISDRSLINDEVVLPLYDNSGNRLAYSLEPQMPFDAIDPLQALPWDFSKGELTVSVAAPDGSVTFVGTKPFVGKSGTGPTTKDARFTAWKPSAYGLHTVTAKGWMQDLSGRRIEAGGTYRFWIAKRMTMATATFQGMAYPVGTKYGRDIAFSPAVPADVTVTATLYPGSDAAKARSVTYSGKATEAGVFGAAQGMQSFPLDAPGEYHASILARYTDADGHLWVCVMRHAGVVYPADSPIVARGKKVLVDGKPVERGETGKEGWVDDDGESHLQHVTFPWNAGDVLLIAAEGEGANKIEPVMTYEVKGEEKPWDSRLNSVGVSNLSIRTSNGYSPHLFPEFVTDVEYYYGAAPRPGFMSRFLVGESNVKSPYWPTSPNSFGGQIGAHSNGDQPGDVYRLLGGVVRRPKDGTAQYAGYLASAFLLPAGTNNNRVVAPGSEDLIGPLGTKARFFLVGLRPGMAYELGAAFAPAVQIDPILPVKVRFVLTYPDGRTKTAEGTGDAFGSFVGAERWPLDVTGAYRYTLAAEWDGHAGGMPGLTASGGELYVYRKERPSGAAGLRVTLPSPATVSPTTGIRIDGTSTAKSVRCAVIMPGAVISVGEIPVESGRFTYRFDPLAVHAAVPLYDVVNNRTEKPELGRLVHVTFFTEEKAPDGTTFHDFARVILRGATAVTAR